MKNLFFTLIVSFLFFESFGQPVFTGSIILQETEYAGISSSLPQTSAANLPPSTDLTRFVPPAGNQGKQNSCVAWALAYGASAYYAKKIDNTWSFINKSGQLKFERLFSPSFVYNQVNKGADNGSNYIEALDLLKEHGVCTWTRMPYIDTDYTSKPLQTALQEAQNFRIERYYRLGERQDLFSDIKEQLANFNPVVASAISDIKFLSGGMDHDPNTLYLWKSIGSYDPRMGHAILIVGYDDSLQAFKFLNSYGKKWGNNGFGYISYNIFNGVIKQAFVIKPSFSNNLEGSIIADNHNDIDQKDINSGLDLSVSTVQHMNSKTDPEVMAQDRFMTVKGSVSIPANSGNTAQIVIYYYLIDQDGYKTPLPGSMEKYRLPSGQAMSSTPPLPIDKAIDNLGWYSTIPYYAFPRYATANTLPTKYTIEAEPALIIDGFSVRVGSTFRFFVIQ